MRVVMTTDTVGGVWTFTRELVGGLLERGCAVALVSVGRAPSRCQSAWAEETERRWLDRFWFRSVDVALEWEQENECAYSGASEALLQMMEEFDGDVLHSNQFCFGALPVQQAKVVTAHSDVLSWAKSCGREPMEDTPWLRRYRALVERGLAGADVVVAPTRWMMDAVGSNFGLPHKRLVISNGRNVTGTNQGIRKLQAITAGRIWDEAKGIAMLRDVSSPIPLLVAGECSREGAGVPMNMGQIQMLGALSDESILALFSESSIYICASRYEPFGLAALEAALCGCAVVANDIASLREVWADGALYFDGADSLSRLLRVLCADRTMLEEARERSWKRAQRYNRDAMTEAYLSLYATAKAHKREMADVA